MVHNGASPGCQPLGREVELADPGLHGEAQGGRGGKVGLSCAVIKYNDHFAPARNKMLECSIEF